MMYTPDRITQGVVASRVVMGGQGGYTISPSIYEGEIPAESPIVRDVHRPFSLQGFAEARTPIVIGQADVSQVPDGIKLNSLPIKFPATEYRIPAELLCVRGVISHIAAYEARINPSVDRYYSYLSLERTYVEAGQKQRSAALHCDGIQGPRIHPKVPVERGYAVVDNAPTEFFPQAFEMGGVDVDKHLIDPIFEYQVDRRKAVSFPLGAIVLFDAYCVHQATAAAQAGPRTFLRLTYATRQYDRMGNSINQLFDDEYRQTGWQFQPRPIPTHLERPPKN